MGASPVLPSEFKGTLTTPSMKVCRKWALDMKFRYLFYKWFSWAFNADGTISDDFKSSIGVTVGALAAPDGVLASDGTYTDHVNVVWNPVSGATYYEIFRGTSSDPSGATSLGTVSSPVTTFTDSTVADDQVYWYFIKSKNATDASGFSAGDKGFSDSSGGGGSGSSGTQTFTGSSTFTVPAGVTTLTAEAWGGSGGGGGSGCPFCLAGTSFYGGGGGGSGEYLKVTGIPVTPGDIITIIIGEGGNAGSGPNTPTSGGPGGATILRLVTDLVTANGGAGGAAGRTGPNNGAHGAGGSGGSNTVGTLDTQTSGNDGGDGTLSATPAGGAAGAANTGGSNPGGAGGANSAGTAGSKGRMKITWP